MSARNGARSPSLDGAEEDDEDVQRPVRQTLCGSLAKDANWKCLVLSLLIYACLGAVTWCRTAEVTKVIINLSMYPIRSTRLTSPCEDGYMYVPVAFLAMLYLLYLVECWHCTAGGGAGAALGWGGGGGGGAGGGGGGATGDGGGVVDLHCLLQRVQEMREAQPVVWWKAVCYHYVRRKRQVTRYRHGDAYTSTQVFYERVNSHAAGARFVYAFCGVRDASPTLLLDRAGPITKVRFSKGFAFANVEAAAEFEEQRARFFSEYERRDDYLEMHEGLDLAPGAGSGGGGLSCPSHGLHGHPPGATGCPHAAHACSGGGCGAMGMGLAAGPFRETATALADPLKPPWFTSPLAFWLSSCLLLSWPLRLLVEYNTAYVHYQVTKLFGVNYEPTNSLTPTSVAPSLGPALPPSFAPPTGGGSVGGAGGGLSRGSTIDSADLDWSIRDNCAVVPSYSEALLMMPPQPPSLGPAELQLQMLLSEAAMAAGAVSGAEAECDAEAGVAGAGAGAAPTQPLLARSLSAGGRRRSHQSAVVVGSATAAGAALSRSSTAGRLVLFYATPLAPRCPEDPRGGRQATTPTEDPPPYEDALRLPVLSRLRRSLTERGELCRRLGTASGPTPGPSGLCSAAAAGRGGGGSAVAAAAVAASATAAAAAASTSASAADAASTPTPSSTSSTASAAAGVSSLWFSRGQRRSEPSGAGGIISDVQQVRLARARLSMETSL